MTSVRDTAWAGEDAPWAEGHMWTLVSPAGSQGLAQGKEEPVQQGCVEGAGPAFKEHPGWSSERPLVMETREGPGGDPVSAWQGEGAPP